MELTGKIHDFTIDYISGKARIAFDVNEKDSAVLGFNEFKDTEKLAISVCKYRKKRSLNANNYAWKLITEIGNVLHMSKEDVYLEMLRRYGQSDMISALADIPIHGYLKYCDEAGESVLNGKVFKHYKVYKGSSEFDTKEMSIFIDGVVSEAKELGIQTETPEQIAELKSLWREHEKADKGA